MFNYESGEEEQYARGVGAMLSEIRQQWQLTLREVEERSLRFAEEEGDQSYKVSASWLVCRSRETRIDGQ